MAEKRKHDELSKDEDLVISLQDIINEDEELETTANAVLGGSDDQDCTYSNGYITRQALYACSTCSSDGNPVGVCLACSLECHEGHTLYELYTKRNFRCDCGNSKCHGVVCKLCPQKSNVNEHNEYNQNFKGVYCTCGRPYPDPEDDVVDEMIQCVICEDWYHGRHLKREDLPVSSDYAEMICQLCMEQKTEFLWYYSWGLNEQVEVDILNGSCDNTIPKIPNLTTEGGCTGDGSTQQSLTSNLATESGVCRDKDGAINRKVNESECLLKSLERKFASSSFTISATFWPDGWRGTLCSCVDCVKMLKEKKLIFLLSKDDSVAEYEKKGASRHQDSSMDRGMQALGEMNRLQQVEVIQGYNEMKGKLSDFLKTFADEGRVVTEEDIKSFFQRMSERKKQRVVIPHRCK